MHASFAKVGVEYDNAMIAVILYICYQGLMSTIGVTDSMQPPMEWVVESYTEALELSEIVAYLPLTTEPKDWYDTMAAMHWMYPRWQWNLIMSFFGLGYGFVFPWSIAEWLMNRTMDLFATPDWQRDWYDTQYKPAMKELVANYRVPWYKALYVALKLWGVLTKLIWAFVFQEEVFAFFLPDWAYSPFALSISIFFTPHINFFASMLTGYP